MYQGDACLAAGAGQDTPGRRAVQGVQGQVVAGDEPQGIIRRKKYGARFHGGLWIHQRSPGTGRLCLGAAQALHIGQKLPV